MSSDIRTVQYKRGATVIIKDSPNPGFFYVVSEGTLSIDSEKILTDRMGRFARGDTFGLVSALTGRPYLSTVIAETDASVMKVPVSALGKFLTEQRPLALKMLSIYSRELRAWQRAVIGPVNEAGKGSPSCLFEDAAVYLKMQKNLMAARAYKMFLTWAYENPVHTDPENMVEAQQRTESLPKISLPPRGEGISIGLSDGEPVFLENENNDDFYLIQEGKIRITRLMGNEEFLIDVLGPGEIFGEMSALEKKPRMASATAQGNARVLTLSLETFTRNTGAAVLQGIFTHLAERIWMASVRLQIAQMTDPSGKLYCFTAMAFLSLKPEERKKPASTLFSYQDLLQMTLLQNQSKEKLEHFTRDKNFRFDKDCITVTSPVKVIQTASTYNPLFRRFLD